MRKTPKLILNLKDKNNYEHCELLKYYKYLGVKVKKIYRIISFKPGVANLLKRECNRKKSQSCGHRTPETHLLL